MLNNNIKYSENVPFFEFFQNTSSNLFNLPNEIRVSKQFCFWRYERSKQGEKLKKVPYGYSKKSKCLERSLSDFNKMFSFSEFLELRPQVHSTYGLGLVLTNGPFTVIDIDNYQYHASLNQLIINMLHKKAYIELSPSGKGLHIFFIGKCYKIKNKGTKSLIIKDSNIRTTCEIYSGKDVRYITLTGQTLYTYSNSSPLATELDILNELQDLKNLFFCNLEKPNSLEIVARQNASMNWLYDKLVSKTSFFSFIDFINTRIKHDSILYKKYINLCNTISNGYTSPSEADWAFCKIVVSLIPLDISSSEIKYQLIEYLFKRDRKFRKKIEREDYLSRTINSVLKVSKNNNTTSFNNNLISKNSIISKKVILKMCNNIINIFHLGRTVQNFEYSNQDKDNYCRATIPNSLNQTDCKYFLELLWAYLNSVNKLSNQQLVKNKFVIINIKSVLRNLKVNSISGRSYQRFFASLNRLSKVIIEYDKKINLDNLRHISVEPLLSYHCLYSKHEDGNMNSCIKSYRKLSIRMHPIFVDIVNNASYNYSLFNKNSYDSLTSDKMKFLYLYFACLTMPGKHSVQLSIDDLLSLWPTTNLRQLINARRKEIIFLLKEFSILQSKFDDLDVTLINENGSIVGLNLQKRKLQLV